MSRSAIAIFMIGAVVLIYVWLSVPGLGQYSLQLTAGLFLAYVVTKRLGRSGLAHNTLFPVPRASGIALEFSILTAAFLLLVSSTGGVGSVFFPVLYFLLFISVFVLDFASLSLLCFLITLFLWSISNQSPTPHEAATLLSIPALLPLLIFAKLQYNQAKIEERAHNSLERRQYDFRLFLATFVKPKLEQISKLSEYPEENAQSIQKQTRILLEETNQELEDLV